MRHEALRWAIIGAGGMGRWRVDALLKRRDLRLVAACDVDARALASLPPEVARFSDWRALVEGAEIDAASVVLPHHMYPEVVGALLQRGAHVLKEKPFARDLEDALTMSRLAEASGKELMVAGQRKFTASFRAAQQRVDELGEIFLTRASILYRSDAIVRDGNWGWRGTRRLSGGVALVDSGWHILEMVALLRGLPSRVIASTGQMGVAAGKHDVDEQAALILEFPDGGIAVVLASFVTIPPETRLLLYGTRGTLDVDVERDRVTWFDGARGRDLHVAPGPDPATLLYDAFVERIGGERPPGAWREALQVQRIIEAGYRSAAQGGCPVRLDDVPGATQP